MTSKMFEIVTNPTEPNKACLFIRGIDSTEIVESYTCEQLNKLIISLSDQLDILKFAQQRMDRKQMISDTKSFIIDMQDNILKLEYEEAVDREMSEPNLFNNITQGAD
jgi:hypothetical protein